MSLLRSAFTWIVCETRSVVLMALFVDTSKKVSSAEGTCELVRDSIICQLTGVITAQSKTHSLCWATGMLLGDLK